MKAEYGTLVSGDLHENTLIIEMDEAITLRAGNYAVIRIESIADQELLDLLLTQHKN